MRVKTGEPLNESYRLKIKEFVKEKDLKLIAMSVNCSWETMRGILSISNPSKITKKNKECLTHIRSRAILNKIDRERYLKANIHGLSIELDRIRKIEFKYNSND